MNLVIKMANTNESLTRKVQHGMTQLTGLSSGFHHCLGLHLISTTYYRACYAADVQKKIAE